MSLSLSKLIWNLILQSERKEDIQNQVHLATFSFRKMDMPVGENVSFTLGYWILVISPSSGGLGEANNPFIEKNLLTFNPHLLSYTNKN